MLRALAALIAAIAIIAPATARTAPPAGQDWYYIERNVVQGGYWVSEILDLADRGVILPATQVFEPGNGWRFARDVPVLQDRFGAAPAGRVGAADPLPPPPPPPPGAPIEAQPLPEPGPRSDSGPAMPGSVDPGRRPETGGAAARDADAATYLSAGPWRAVLTDLIAGRSFQTTLDYDFRPDGTYTSAMSTRMPDSPDLPPLSEQVEGRWRVLADTMVEYTVVLTPDSGLPADPLYVRVYDDRTMVSRDGKISYERLR